MAQAKKRIGILAGTFDPVHAGHISFALEAIKQAKLDAVYFMPERRPRRKPAVEHFGHRTAMITRAIRPYQNLGLLELPDIYFDVKRTLPKLKREFSGCRLVLLMGGEVARSLPNWPEARKLTRNCELIIGLRTEQTKAETLTALQPLGVNPERLIFIKSTAPHISSSNVRNGLRRNRPAHGLLKSVRRYSRANWLYVSLSKEQ